jgi:hypothetical protein
VYSTVAVRLINGFKTPPPTHPGNVHGKPYNFISGFLYGSLSETMEIKLATAFKQLREHNN